MFFFFLMLAFHFPQLVPRMAFRGIWFSCFLSVLLFYALALVFPTGSRNPCVESHGGGGKADFSLAPVTRETFGESLSALSAFC